jgi:hypothetical protein
VAGGAVHAGNWSSQLVWASATFSIGELLAGAGLAGASENAGRTATADPTNTTAVTSAAIPASLGVSLKSLLGARALRRW